MSDSCYKVYIYGAGNEYNRFASYLSVYQTELVVLGVITTEKMDIATMDGYPCLTADDIDKDEMDFVIIAIADKWREAFDTLKQKGIGEDKIIRSKAFYYPNFNLKEYLELKNSKISILSNFCMGGWCLMNWGSKYCLQQLICFVWGKIIWNF